MACEVDADCASLDTDCALGQCQDGACELQDLNDGTTCDDGAFCTENDTCSAGACSGDAIDCSTATQCVVGQCDEDADACVEVADPALDGTDCDDGDPCSDTSVCAAGACQQGAQSCDTLTTECTVGVCDPGMGCVAQPTNDAMPCDVSNICAASACNAGACTVQTQQFEGAVCDDGLFCTVVERCAAGVCTPTMDSPCPPDQGCGAWTCDEAADTCMVAAANEGQACNDNRSCTQNTSCEQGVCKNGNIPNVVFSENFSNNNAGWTIGPEWAIGPTLPTPCDQELMCFNSPTMAFGAYPGGDPWLDHSPSMDNGVAGVALGGIIVQAVHGQYYVTSPPFNANVPGALTLSYFRWLNSDYTPYMQNVVEVLSPAVGWTQVFTTGSLATADAPYSLGGTPAMGWLYQSFDVTPYKSANMQVRFGFNVGSTGVFPAPGFNVDDVLVAAVGCPDGP